MNDEPRIELNFSPEELARIERSRRLEPKIQAALDAERARLKRPLSFEEIIEVRRRAEKAG